MEDTFDAFPVGTHVAISTSTGGCYHKKTGTVLNQCTCNQQLTDKTGMEYIYGIDCAGWYRVLLDSPAYNGDSIVDSDIFLAHELTKI